MRIQRNLSWLYDKSAKDIIHINWLIHNVTNDNIEQVISTNQASDSSDL